ncbi:MAG TPA: FecR domain-containing protein [Hymenobacter sp.]|jgi:hypothetical protein
MRNRICLALVWLCTLVGAPRIAHPQAHAGSLLERKVTVTFSQAPLESVLRTLRRQYGVRISYSNTVLDLRQPVTLSVQNQPLRMVLNTLLANKNIGYELVGDQVVLHAVRPPKPKPTPSKGAMSNAVGKSSEGSKASAAKPAPTKPASPRAPEVNKPKATPESNSQSIENSRPAVAAAPPDSTTVKPAVAPDSVAKTAVTEPTLEKTTRLTRTRQAQVSFLGPLGSNGLRSGQTVNKLSVNVLGGYAAGVDGFEAAGLFNVDRDSVRGAQVAGLFNIVGRHLSGFQGAGLLNVLGGAGTGWQAAGLLNVATRGVNGVQTAGLFNYNGPAKPADVSVKEANTSTDTPNRQKTVQAAGLFNVSLTKVRGVQAAGLFNAAGKVQGVQLAGLFNIADSVDGVSIAPLNFVRHGYHRFEVVNTESWPVGASLKLGGSAKFYTFFAGAYDNFGSDNRRWALGYGAGTEFWTPRRVSLSLDLLALHVNEEGRGWTNDLNLHNQFRLLVGFAPLRAGGRLRIVAGPTVSVLVTQRYDAERGQIYSRLIQNRSLWLDEGDAATRVLGWVGYCVGLRF